MSGINHKQKTYADGIDLVQLLKEVGHLKWLLIALLIVSIIIAWVYSSFFFEPTYQTTALIQSVNAHDLNHILESDGFKKQLREELVGAHINCSATRFSSYVIGPFLDIAVYSCNPDVAYKTLEAAISLLIEIDVQRTCEMMEQKQLYLQAIRHEIEYNEQFITHLTEQLSSLIDEEDLTEAAGDSFGNLSVALALHLQNRYYLMNEELQISSQVFEDYLEVIANPYLPESPTSTANVLLNIAIGIILAVAVVLFVVLVKMLITENISDKD